MFFHLNSLSRFLPQNLPQSAHFPRVVYLRIFAPQVLCDYHRLIYLDADIHSIRNLPYLWKIELPHGVAAVADQDFSYDTNSEEAQKRTQLASRGIDSDRYFNSGVLVIDPLHWDHEKLSRGLTPYFEKYGAQVRMFDQDYLNHVFSESWTELGPAINYQAKIFDTDLTQWFDPVFLHFSGIYKPWDNFDPSEETHIHRTFRPIYEALLMRAGLTKADQRTTPKNPLMRLKYDFRRAVSKAGLVTSKERRVRSMRQKRLKHAIEYYKNGCATGRFRDQVDQASKFVPDYIPPNLYFSGRQLIITTDYLGPTGIDGDMLEARDV